ncbi:MAG: peptidylprolyl isomerase, partial [Planctomycetota bacterium]|nr:peptidylprolyl isomerase [Planctomycetota bacterium]
RIVTFEAAALEVRLPDGVIADEVARRMAALERTAREVGAPDLEVYVKRRLGLEVATLRAELEREAAVDLLAPRCVRAWLLSSDRREIRAIAVDDRAAADQVQARLSRGDDFEALAREFSKDPSAEEGGRMPPVVRADQSLARTAFAIQVGSVSEPIQDARGFVFVKVVGAPDPLEGDWNAVGALVEADLAERPIEDPEFWQWKDAMYQRYDIDITPFLELASR